MKRIAVIFAGGVGASYEEQQDAETIFRMER